MTKHTHYRQIRHKKKILEEKKRRRNKRVTLINTPKDLHLTPGTEFGVDNTYPMGLLQISSALKNDGHRVSYLDANFYHKGINEISDYLQKTKPQLVGLNATFPNIHVALAIAEASKSVLPETKVVLGGAAPTLAPNFFMKNPFVDYVIAGEGERAAVMLARHLDEPLMVPSLYYKSGERVMVTDSVSHIPINKVPLIDVDNIPSEIKEGTGEIMLITSRGCNGACSFCSTPSIWGKGVKNLRSQSAERIFREIDNYEANGFEFDRVYFLDDNFTTDWDRLVEFMGGWDIRYLPKGYSWKCLSRVRGINSKDKLERMVESGCHSVSVGVESSSNETLRRIGKQLKIEEVDNFLQNAKHLPLKTKGFFMIGFPWETEEDVLHTIDYAANSGFDDVAFNIVVAYPSTALHRQVYGLENERALPSFHCQSTPENAEGSAYSYLLRYGTRPAQSLSRHLSIEQLLDLKELAFQIFYDGK